MTVFSQRLSVFVVLISLALVVAGCGSKKNDLEAQKFEAMMHDPIWTQISIDGQPSQLLGNAATSGSWGGSNGLAFKTWEMTKEQTDTQFQTAVRQASALGSTINSVDCELHLAEGTRTVAGDWPASLTIGTTESQSGAGTTELRVSLTLGDGDHTKFGQPSQDFVSKGCSEDFVSAVHKTR